MIVDKERLAGFDIEYFNACAKYHEAVRLPFWADLRQMLQALVQEAQDAMEGNVSSDPNVSHSMRIRWQQRKVMADKIINEVESKNNDYIEMAKSLASQEEHEYNDSNAVA